MPDVSAIHGRLSDLNAIFVHFQMLKTFYLHQTLTILCKYNFQPWKKLLLKNNLRKNSHTFRLLHSKCEKQIKMYQDAAIKFVYLIMPMNILEVNDKRSIQIPFIYK